MASGARTRRPRPAPATRLAGRRARSGADGRPVWFVSVNDGTELPADEVVDRALAAVTDAAGAGVTPGTNRVRPVLAMPVLGLEGSGHDQNRGEIICRLLERAHDAARDLGLDIVVVTPKSSVYAAAQHARPALADELLEPDHRRHAERLGSLVGVGDLALFFGAGVSTSAGLPTWRDMIRFLCERTGLLERQEYRTLTPLDQAQLLERREPRLGEHVAAICHDHDRPSLAHVLLAGLGRRRGCSSCTGTPHIPPASC